MTAFPCPNLAHSPRLAAGRWSCPDCATTPAPVVDVELPTEGAVTDAEWTTFVLAIRAAAAACDGVVHQRHVRPRIRGKIESKHVGLCYRRAVAAGLLLKRGHEESDDAQGRNAGRMEPIYALAERVAA